MPSQNDVDRVLGLSNGHRTCRPAWPVALLCLLVCVLMSGCSAMLSKTTGRLADNLANAMLNHNDPETVRQGAPAYLLMVDSLIAGDPDNPQLLLTGATLYGSYAGAFAGDEKRARVLSLTAKQYGWQALCRVAPDACDSWEQPYEEFERAVGSLEAKHVPALYGAAAAWATWIQANRSDWVAIADKARVQVMMERVLELDPQHEGGRAHLYLGVLDTLLPAALGGKPEEGREHFEGFIDMSGGRDLQGKVLLAREYARLVFDRDLHDRLCREVIESDPVQPGLTLSNTIAIAEAGLLLETADDYFGEPEPETEQ